MSLRDQFKKANLLSDKDARRLAHEARIERKDKGREQLEQEEAARAAELQQQQAGQRARTSHEQHQNEAARKAREEAAAVQAILATEAKKPGPGTVKWYFEVADGTLPWLEVSPREAQELRAGMICIVRTGPRGTHDYKLLPSELTRRVGRLLPEVVVFAPRGVVAAGG